MWTSRALRANGLDGYVRSTRTPYNDLGDACMSPAARPLTAVA
jgi:hypothetical protein